MGHESDTWLQTTLASCIDIACIAHFAKLKHGLNTPSMIHPNPSRPFVFFWKTTCKHTTAIQKVIPWHVPQAAAKQFAPQHLLYLLPD